MEWLLLIPVLAGALAVSVWLLIRTKRKQREERQNIDAAKQLLLSDILAYEIKNPVEQQDAVSPRLARTLIALTVGKKGKRYVMDPAVTITFGRGYDSLIWLAEATVSEHHCRIRWDGANVVLEDTGSANGTQVKRGLFHTWTLRSASLALQDGDRFRVGSTLFQIRIFVFDSRLI